MADVFEDIKIEGPVQERTTQLKESSSSPRYAIAVQLSGEPSEVWCELFGKMLHEMDNRTAPPSVEIDQDILLYRTEERLAQANLNRIKEAITETNKQYRARLKREEEEEAARQERVTKLLGRLNFD